MRIRYCEEMLKKLQEGISITPTALEIGEAAVLGMLYEASASPSPGLVSPYSTGCHKDMDFFTFLRSSASIAGVMYICAQIGLNYQEGILERLRAAGTYGEKNMLHATCGVNTHKGLLFLLGIACGAAGRCISISKKVNRSNIAYECGAITKGIVDRELNPIGNCDIKTNGERLFLEFGVKGIRGEVENGLPSVLNTGLPMFEEAIEAGLTEPQSLCHSLVGIMTSVEDTTVINRCGMKGYYMMKETAKKAMELGGMITPKGRQFISDMDKIFIESNISPGGAADLLAVTVMIHKLERDFK